MTFDAFALILAMLVLGYAFQRLRVLPDNAARSARRHGTHHGAGIGDTVDGRRWPVAVVADLAAVGAVADRLGFANLARPTPV
jgi:hypothetical protein